MRSTDLTILVTLRTKPDTKIHTCYVEIHTTCVAPARFAGILYPVPGRRLTYLILAAFAILSANVSLAIANEPEPPPMLKGADTPSVRECGEWKSYEYKNYVVNTRHSPDFAGQDIYIFKHPANLDDPCSLRPHNTWYKINAGEFGGANTFLGMRGGLVFIDEWPGRDHKRLLVIDAAAKSLVYFDWYADPVLEGDTLLYKRVLKSSRKTKSSIPCPDAAKWEEEGKQALYTEKMSLDLSTMKATNSGEFSCEPAAAIQRATRYTH